MVRANWPSPMCERHSGGEHSWVRLAGGIGCERCYEAVAWADAKAFVTWCRYVYQQSWAVVERCN